MSHGLTADGQPIYDEHEEDIGPLSPTQVGFFYIDCAKYNECICKLNVNMSSFSTF